MEAVALQCSHLSPCRHVKGITQSSVKTLPPSTFLPPSRRIEPITQRITHRSMKTLAAVDDNNGVSAPPPAGHDEWPPLDSYEEYLEYLEKENLLHLPLITESETMDFPAQSEHYCDNACERHEFEELRRMGRQLNASQFRSKYTHGNIKEGCNNSKEQRTCIWPGDSLSWQEESSGIMWVCVYGRDSICVVTRNEDPDEARLRGFLKQFPKDKVLTNFRKSLIVEIEDLADPSSKIRERFHMRIKKPFGVDLADPSSKIRERFHMGIKKPFGVVSMIPDAYKSCKGSGHEASSVEYGEAKAIKFLQEKVKNRRVFTVTGTIQTAIAAFEQLFQKKFKADEIKVSVVDPYYIVVGKDTRDPSVESLTIRQINKHLAVINKPGSEDSRTLREQYYASAFSVYHDFK